MQDDVQTVFFNLDEFAESGTYTAFADKSVVENVPCIVERQSEGQENYGVSDKATVLVPESSVATPERLDTLTVGGTTYTILSRIYNEFGVWSLSAETTEKHKP